MSPGGNNGIGLRAPFEGDAAYQGMEIQVLDDPAPQYKDIQPGSITGPSTRCFRPSRARSNRPGRVELLRDHSHGAAASPSTSTGRWWWTRTWTP